jgi:hypothetical protein
MAAADIATAAPGPRGKVRLRDRFRYRPKKSRPPRKNELSANKPYRFASPCLSGQFLDLGTDADPALLASRELPLLKTPDDVAEWIGLPVAKVAWLSGRFYEGHRPQTREESHYHYHWLRKRSGGHRLIEAPKPLLKLVQRKILEEILNRVPAHERAFGFVPGRSATQNAAQHVGQYVVVKFDLENFYASVRYSRVVAIYRAMGFSRAAGLWLARLTTAAAPTSLDFPKGDPHGLLPYISRHLPQGAPTSPALANLSAFSLDVRLSGLARSFHATYSRYADDLTFSGSHRFAAALRDFIPLVQKIVREERFALNHKKRKVIRQSGRQTVTGAVVNSRMNPARKDYDRLKATLHNCEKLGPSSQNRAAHEQFQSHLLGRIAYVASLNPARGAKLRAIFDRIDWSR